MLKQLFQSCTEIAEVIKALIFSKDDVETQKTSAMLKQLFQSRTEIAEVIKALIFSKDDVETTIFDGSTEKLVEVDILTNMNVLLFLSDLDISDEYISLLTSIYNFTKRKDDYKIVWIPIVEEWTLELQEKFETLRGKMSWYMVAKISAPIAGIKYVKEDWEFDGKPILVVLNSQSQLQLSDDHHKALISWNDACRFVLTQKTNERNLISLGDTWFASIVSGIYPSVSKWIKEEKCIFFCGGDSDFLYDFKEKATDIAERAKSSIEVYHVKQNASNDGEDDSFSSFWSAIETMSHIKVISKQIGHYELVEQQVEKLMSYKNRTIGWTVLVQGCRVIIIADARTMNTALSDGDFGDDLSYGAFGDDLVELIRVKSPQKLKGVTVNHSCTMRISESSKVKTGGFYKSFTMRISESSDELKHFIFRHFDVPSGWIIDAYNPNTKYPWDFDTLRGSKLFLFLSRLDISESHIQLIKHVNERIEKDNLNVYKTVWIPIAGKKKWQEREKDNYLLRIAKELSCYTARPHPECIRNIKDEYKLHKKKDYLVLLEMDQSGEVKKYDPVKTIVRDRMERFGFKN